MFKKLDKLVIKAFIGPFVATFFITVLVLVMQFFWLWIDEFVGKGLNAQIIFEFILYQSASLVPLALPLAVLLSSLMTFGNLGESYELIAIKSAGISLLRFMRPIFFATLLISYVAFLFSNHIIPIAQLKSRTLLADIVYAKPSFDIKEGEFYDKLSGFAIKIGQKEKNDSIIKNIIIYEHGGGLQDNFIVASDGVMRVSQNKRFMEFILKNGWRYEERPGDNGKTDFIRMGFSEYSKQFDLSSFGLRQRSADSLNRDNAKMLSMRQLNHAIDSIQKKNELIGESFKGDPAASVPFVRLLDSNWKVSGTAIKADSFIQTIPDSIRKFVFQKATNRISTFRSSVEVLTAQYNEQQRNLRIHKIEWHRKIALSASCLVLFLIGAPLGSIIRKGGLGMPLVISIVFFMLFYFSSTTGEKFAKEGELSALTGMWLSTFLLVPLGVFITYQALHDSKVFSKEFYTRLSRNFRARWKRSR